MSRLKQRYGRAAKQNAETNTQTDRQTKGERERERTVITAKTVPDRDPERKDCDSCLTLTLTLIINPKASTLNLSVFLSQILRSDL